MKRPRLIAMKSVCRMAVACLWLVGVHAMAAEAYPARPVKIIVPVANGGASDMMARIIAERLGPRLGQPVIVEARPGANSVIAAQYVLGQPADGYTVLLSNSVMTLRTALPKSPYDIRTDFTQVVQVGTGTYILYVNPALPVHSVRELIDYARANPGKLNFASIGIGTATHLCVELLAQLGDFRMVHVPYGGSAKSIQAVVAGDAHAAVDGLALLRGNIDAGKLRALAVTSARRWDIAPDLPGMEEAGVPGYDVKFWIGVSVRKGTPKEIVDRLSTEITHVLQEETVRQAIRKLGTSVTSAPGDELSRIAEREVTMWSDVVRKANITLD